KIAAQPFVLLAPRGGDVFLPRCVQTEAGAVLVQPGNDLPQSDGVVDELCSFTPPGRQTVEAAERRRPAHRCLHAMSRARTSEAAAIWCSSSFSAAQVGTSRPGAETAPAASAGSASTPMCPAGDGAALISRSFTAPRFLISNAASKRSLVPRQKRSLHLSRSATREAMQSA